MIIVSSHGRDRGDEIQFSIFRTLDQGYIQDFFLGGECLCAGKLISCGLLGGSGGMLPQKNFEILSPLRVI